jgi:hypothetical protein
MKKLLIVVVVVAIAACLVWKVAAASTSLYSNGSVQLNQTPSSLSSGTIDASEYENLILSFNYDAQLTGSEGFDSGDSLVYGWSVAGVDTDLGTVNGHNEIGAGAATDETGSVNVSLPLGAQVAGLAIYLRVNVNSDEDAVLLTNVDLSGDAVVVVITPSGDITNNESESYSTIQAAVDGTDEGGTITVPAGTYSENVVINKALTLLGANAGVAGNSSRGPESVLDGGDASSPVQITSDDVTVDGFTITNGSNGLGAGVHIAIGISGGYSLVNNVITGNTMGVYANCADSCLIQNNLFDANNKPGAAGGAGIYLEDSHGLTVANNEFKNHTENNPVILAWIASPSHTDFVFSGNNVHDNFSGPFILGVSGGVFSDNIVSATGATALSFGGGNSGISLSNNTITNSDRGVRVNDFSADFGVVMGPNSAFTFSGNTFSNNSEYNVGLLPGGYDGTEFDAPPTLILTEGASMSAFTSNGFVDPGATATDNMGNLLTVDVSGSVDDSNPGLYTRTYSATDIFGHTTSLDRTVLIRATSGGGGGGGSTGGQVLGAFTEAQPTGQVLGLFNVTPPSKSYQITFLENQITTLMQELVALLQTQVAAVIKAQGN